MRALFRYAFLKSSRDQSLLGLTIAPAVMLGAPILGIAVWQILRGVGRYPFTIDPRTTAESTATAMVMPTAVGSIIMAAIAGFWLFRLEIGHQSIATMVMAARARAITLVAALYAAIVGISGFILAFAVVVIATAHVPETTPRALLLAVCATLAAGAAGILIATISSETAMALPAVAASVAIAVIGFKWTTPAVVAGCVITSSLFILVAAALMERRCAA